MRIRSLIPGALNELEDALKSGDILNSGHRDALLDRAEEVVGAGELPVDMVFDTKGALANVVSVALAGVDREVLNADRGLWSWIALLYLPQLMGPERAADKTIGDTARYALSSSRRREYRHLIKGPYNAYRLHGDGARLLLQHPVHRWSDIEEQIAGVQEIVRMPGAMEAADLLYYDVRRGAPKRGITNRKKPGTVRRFAAVVQQLDLTYDLYSMAGPELLELLPPEFDRFKAG